ncbi:MAG: GNAT family N-acetyltransferase [Betaproteobacteria bacterium]|nr:GNAT family N-acetyltransferase [Betaproteobacteria bacterium]
MIGHFVAYPPSGFQAFRTASGTPGFSAHLDLLTTADDAFRLRVAALPLYRFWGRWLRARSCFVGTTVSEYAPFPRDLEAEQIAQELLHEVMRERAAGHALLIVKDLPAASPLLDAASNAHADALAAGLGKAGFTLLEGQALAWVPIDFLSAQEFVARLSPARRKDIRRKLRGQDALDVGLLPTGEAFADPAFRADLYRLYRNVYEQSSVHFDRLTPQFFDAVLQDARLEGRMFLYRHAGRLIGWNLCFVCGDTLLDKYVGFEYPDARDHSLYFVSWMRNLDYAASLGLKRYVAGWTDPRIKAHLGASFTFTRHAVYPLNRLLRGILARFAGRFEGDRAWFEKEVRAADRP